MSDLHVLIPTSDVRAGAGAPPATFTPRPRLGPLRLLAERRRLARYDRMGEQLAELDQLRRILQAAEVLIDAGWVQNGWFSVSDQSGSVRIIDARNAQALREKAVVGACLVGGIMQAGGGLAAVHSQPVQRALDLTWHTLFRSERQSVEFCPPPAVRAAHVRNLTAWNDRPQRTREQVTALLGAADRVAAVQASTLQLSALRAASSQLAPRDPSRTT